MSKNKRFKDVFFAIELQLTSDKSWHRLSNCNDLEMAEREVRTYELTDKQCFGKKMNYRIIKVTITKEVVG